jgi:vacuolar-type H+-ATPase subunit H
MSEEHADTRSESVEALLERVSQAREAECAEILRAAREEAAAIEAQAFREARQRVREAIAAERRRFDQEQRSAEAQARTRLRRLEQKAVRRLLDNAWEQLRTELERRWRSGPTRRDWVVAALRQAVRVLPGRHWRVEHPPDWDPDELAEHFHHIQEADEVDQIRFEAVDELRAGIRLSASGAILDATLRGLLAEPRRVESELLGHLAAESGEVQSETGYGAERERR